jgi:hypothetical protein
MDNGYHEKRANPRRSSDKDRTFLLAACKLALRLKTIDSIHQVLKGAVDSVEDNEKGIKQ